MAGVSAARRAAFRVLLAVEQRSAFVDELLHGPAVDGLSERDRGLASQIILGVLRKRGVLDWMIEQPARRPAERIDLEPLTALRMAAYQIGWLDRVPARAAVSESVELVKRSPRRSAASFVNAVLRRLPNRPTEARERELCSPAWLRDRWRKRFGDKHLPALLRTLQSKPRTWLRFDARQPQEKTQSRLLEDGIETQPSEDVPGAFELLSGSIRRSAAWAEGLVRIQDVSSQAVTSLLDLAPGVSVLDLCAAPGGKTRQIAGILGTERGIIACDRHAHRLRRMQELGRQRFDRIALDASGVLPFTRRFDRILVDAPCSGTGTLASNPDITWRLTPADIAELQTRQTAILRQALSALAPAGVLVYSTCSLEPEENEEVVRSVIETVGDIAVTGRMQRLPGRDEGEGFEAFRIERAGR